MMPHCQWLVRECFKRFGALEQLEFIHEALAGLPHNIYDIRPCEIWIPIPSAEQASETLIHRIWYKNTLVQKSSLSYPTKNRDHRLFVEGFQKDTYSEKVRACFEKFGKLDHYKQNCNLSYWFVVFKSKVSLHHVATKGTCLGWL